MGFVQPLNLYENLVNVFAGGEVMFIMLAILFVLYFAAKNRMSLGAALPMVGFVVIVVSSSMVGGSLQPLLMAILLIAALALSIVIVRLTDR